MDLSTLLDDETLREADDAYMRAFDATPRYSEAEAAGWEAARQVLLAALAPLVERIATLEQQRDDAIRLMEAARDESRWARALARAEAAEARCATLERERDEVVMDLSTLLDDETLLQAYQDATRASWPPGNKPQLAVVSSMAAMRQVILAALAPLVEELSMARLRAEAAEARCASLERERDEARREVARLQRVNEIQTRALRILCADHRDKVREGRCVECDREQAEADLDACRGAREITEAALTHAHALINAVVVALGGSVSDYEQSWSALRHIRVMREQRDSLAADRDRLAAALTGLRADLIARRDAGVAHFEMEPEADYSAGFAHCADGILAELDRLTADGPEGGKP